MMCYPRCASQSLLTPPRPAHAPHQGAGWRGVKAPCQVRRLETTMAAAQREGTSSAALLLLTTAARLHALLLLLLAVLG